MKQQTDISDQPATDTQNIPHWIETSWRLPKDQAESLGLALEQTGSLGSYEKMGLLAEDEAKRTESEVIAYFADTSEMAKLEQRLNKLAVPPVTLENIRRIPQENWATEWKKYFKPFFLTPKIVIRPSWENYTVQGNEKVVTLDPGMAFGTGQHDTTRFCAELLCELAETTQNPLSLIDVGCGSGILSLIAKKCGYSSVIGIDNDPAAVETANENLERNPELKPVTFILTSGGLDHEALQPSDIVVANIIAETLCELKAELVRLVKPDGRLVLSGILPERAHLVTEAFSDCTLETAKKSKDWHAYVYRRP